MGCASTLLKDEGRPLVAGGDARGAAEVERIEPADCFVAEQPERRGIGQAHAAQVDVPAVKLEDNPAWQLSGSPSDSAKRDRARRQRHRLCHTRFRCLQLYVLPHLKCARDCSLDGRRRRLTQIGPSSHRCNGSLKTRSRAIHPAAERITRIKLGGTCVYEYPITLDQFHIDAILALLTQLPTELIDALLILARTHAIWRE
eukprot:6129099-Pleurochrysis_carterae.AAC.2